MGPIRGELQDLPNCRFLERSFLEGPEGDGASLVVGQLGDQRWDDVEVFRPLDRPVVEAGIQRFRMAVRRRAGHKRRAVPRSGSRGQRKRQVDFKSGCLLGNILQKLFRWICHLYCVMVSLKTVLDLSGEGG